MLVQIRSPYRVRLGIDGGVVSGSLVASLYAVTSLDGIGASPAVSGVLAVPGGAFVELALAVPLADGGRFRFTATAVPTAASPFTGSEDVLVPTKATVPASAPLGSDSFDRVLYGADLLSLGGDLVESQDGDLAEIAGLENVRTSVARRLVANGLPYDPTYGARAREYVDAPSPSAGSLAGELTAQAAQDPRVTKATTSLNLGEAEASLDVQITPVADPSAVFNVRVPLT